MGHETPAVIEGIAGTLKEYYPRRVISIQMPDETPKGFRPSWRIRRITPGGCLFLGLFGRKIEDILVVDAEEIRDGDVNKGKVPFYINQIALNLELMLQLREHLQMFGWENWRGGNFYDLCIAPPELYKHKSSDAEA